MWVGAFEETEKPNKYKIFLKCNYIYSLNVEQDVLINVIWSFFFDSEFLKHLKQVEIDFQILDSPLKMYILKWNKCILLLCFVLCNTKTVMK